MSYAEQIVLGAIQGLTECIPISSKSVVSLAGKLFFGANISQSVVNALFLHIGTFLAAVIYFRTEVWKIITSDRKTLQFMIVATFFTGLVGVPLLTFFVNFSLNDALASLLIGVLLLGLFFLYKLQRVKGKKKVPSAGDGVWTGISQGLSAIPGVSRSGITLFTLLQRKFSLEKAFELSFIMSLPAVAGVQILLPMLKSGFTVSLEMLVGCFTSFIVGLVTIGWLMKFAKKSEFSKAVLILGLGTIIFGMALLIL